MGLTLIQIANKATPDELAEFIPADYVVGNKKCYLQVTLAKHLSDLEREATWQIIEKNMRQMSERSSMGWDPAEKQEQVFHADARFILVREPPAAPEGGTASGQIIACCIFRFEREEGQNVLYCYELQILESARRNGLGRLLMKCLIDIGLRWRMRKIMLTVLRANEAAMAFYKGNGFVVDPSSPGYNSDEADDEWVDEDEDYDYWIMSRKLR